MAAGSDPAASFREAALGSHGRFFVPTGGVPSHRLPGFSHLRHPEKSRVRMAADSFSGVLLLLSVGSVGCAVSGVQVLA